MTRIEPLTQSVFFFGPRSTFGLICKLLFVQITVQCSFASSVHWFSPTTYLSKQLFKVNNRNRKNCEICSTLTVTILERRHWRRSGVFTFNFEHISRLFLVLILSALYLFPGTGFVLKILSENIFFNSVPFAFQKKCFKYESFKNNFPLVTKRE